MTKAIIATEMLCLSKNDIMEFKDMLTISEVGNMLLIPSLGVCFYIGMFMSLMPGKHHIQKGRKCFI